MRWGRAAWPRSISPAMPFVEGESLRQRLQRERQRTATRARSHHPGTRVNDIPEPQPGTPACALPDQGGRSGGDVLGGGTSATLTPPTVEVEVEAKKVAAEAWVDEAAAEAWVDEAAVEAVEAGAAWADEAAIRAAQAVRAARAVQAARAARAVAGKADE